MLEIDVETYVLLGAMPQEPSLWEVVMIKAYEQLKWGRDKANATRKRWTPTHKKAEKAASLKYAKTKKGKARRKKYEGTPEYKAARNARRRELRKLKK